MGGLVLRYWEVTDEEPVLYSQLEEKTLLGS